MNGKLSFVRISDFVSLFQFFLVLPIALICKIFLRGYWLVCEDKNEARDNGYWFFKYITENHRNQKVIYAINKKSVDYGKVAALGKVISYGGFSHWFWYLVSSRNISSQKGGKPNAAVCYLFEVKLRIFRNKRIFLQHGITKDDAEWLYYKNTRFKLFVCGAKPEYDFVKEKFGYPEQNVKYLGFSRFDNLHDAEPDEKLILVMPTWRNWIARKIKNNTAEEDISCFTNTEFYINWNNFLNSGRLDDVLKKNDMTMIFYPHRNMQPYLENFKSESDNIIIADWKKYDIQELLKKSKLLITDFSSVFFDFSYMRKKVIFYQFDINRYRKGQYSQGYFVYEDEKLGEWCDNLDDCVNLIEAGIENGFALSDVQKAGIEEFFVLYDKENSKRIFEEIKLL